MAAITTAVLAGTLTAVSVGSTVHSYQQQKKAARADEKRTEVENRIQERRAQREKLDQLRQARIARATVANTGAVTGLSDSSGTQGTLGSITNQSTANQLFIDMSMQDARYAAQMGNKAAGLRTDAAIWDAVGGIAMQGAQQLGGIGPLLPGSNKTPA